MRVKKYIVDSMPEALTIIRKELGQDAVILDQKKIKIGGFMGFFTKHKLEVIAAVEPRAKKNSSTPEKPILNVIPPKKEQVHSINSTQLSLLKLQNPEQEQNLIQSHSQLNNKQENMHASLFQNQYNQQQLQQQKTNENYNVDKKVLSVTETDDKMVEEIKEMKNLFVKMMLKTNSDEFPDNIKNVYHHLIEKEIDEEVASNLVYSLMEKLGSPKHVANAYLYEILQNEIAKIIEKYIASQQTLEKKQVLAFVGPTGVGKTTTIAKLAAYYVLEKKVSVGFITADTYRIAAVDQLRTYANILNIPVEIVISHDDMRKAIQNLQERDIILIDTAGRNYKKEMYVNELKSLLSVANPDEIYLVHSMTTKQKDMHEITHCFKDIDVKNFIFTKVDETSSYGSILNMLCRHNKQLSILTNGQNVPEDILFIDPKKIAKLIVGEIHE